MRAATLLATACLLASTAAAASQHQASPWPLAFSGPFTELSLFPTRNYTVRGALYYSWALRSQRVDRADGRYNPLCSRYHDEETACQQIAVRNGSRYFLWPELHECCLDCDSGCGALTPNWLDGARSLGVHNVSTGVACEQLVVTGSTSNDYYAYTNTTAQTPCQLADGGGPNLEPYVWDFDVPRVVVGDVPASVFELPSYCAPAKWCRRKDLS